MVTDVKFKPTKLDKEIEENNKIQDLLFKVYFLAYDLQQKFGSIVSGDKQEVSQRIEKVLNETKPFLSLSPKLEFEALALVRNKEVLLGNHLEATIVNIEIVSLIIKNPKLFTNLYFAGYSYLLADCLKYCTMWELANQFYLEAKQNFSENSFNQVLILQGELETQYFSLNIAKFNETLRFALNSDWIQKHAHYASIWKFIKAASLNAEGKFQESNDILNTLDFVTKDKDYYNSQVMLLLFINYYELGKQDLLEKQFTNLRRYVDRSMKDPERKELFKHIHVLLRPLLDPDKDPESIITEKAEEFNAVEHYYKEVWNPSVPDYFHIHQWFKLRGEKEHKFFIEYHDGSKYEAEIKAALEKFSLKF